LIPMQQTASHAAGHALPQTAQTRPKENY